MSKITEAYMVDIKASKLAILGSMEFQDATKRNKPDIEVILIRLNNVSLEELLNMILIIDLFYVVNLLLYRKDGVQKNRILVRSKKDLYLILNLNSAESNYFKEIISR